MRLELTFGNEELYYKRAIELGAAPAVAEQTARLLANPFSGWEDHLEWYMDPQKNNEVKAWLGLGK